MQNIASGFLVFSLRWRNVEKPKDLYDEDMIAHLSKDWTVQRVLEGDPGAVSTFIRLKTNCVGCWLARFCALDDVSGYYGIPIATLLETLQNPILMKPLQE
jgi:hypothetical protein